MEIEAKFEVSDARTFRKLRSVSQLCEFAVSKGENKRIHDTYLDTRARSIWAAGYECRRRKQSRKIIITVKELSRAPGSIYKREELELSLKKDLPPESWPPGPVRDLILSIAAGEPLEPVIELDQSRHVRAVAKGRRVVAEMSLDRVRVRGRDHAPAYSEIECELKGAGTENDLEALAACLKREYRLRPEPRSKFERAWGLYSAPPTGPSSRPSNGHKHD